MNLLNKFLFSFLLILKKKFFLILGELNIKSPLLLALLSTFALQINELSLLLLFIALNKLLPLLLLFNVFREWTNELSFVSLIVFLTNEVLVFSLFSPNNWLLLFLIPNNEL